MTYHSVGEVLVEKKNVLTRLEDRLHSIDQSLLQLRAPSDSWSIAEIVEHLAVAERAMLLLIESLLRKAKAAPEDERGATAFEVSLDAVIERSRVEKFTAPDRFRPAGQMPVSESLAKLREIQSQLELLHPQLEAVDPASVSFRHWTFGPLNLGQWLAFVGYHEQRHLDQIESILNPPDDRNDQV